MVLRRIYGPKTDEVMEGWKKLHSKELHNFCSSPSTRIITMIKEDAMSRACSMNGGEEGCI
jgi:hypothetical protein